MPGQRINKQYLDRVAKLNQSPLNQLARKKLIQAKEQPSAETLHFLQLAVWGLDRLQAPEELRGAVEYLFLKGNPGKVMKLLREEDLDLKGSMSPEDLADEILEQLDSRLTEELDNYSSKAVTR